MHAEGRRRGSKLSPTAKSEHRAGVFALARNDLGIVRCYADPTAASCRGRLQAAHWISVQTLKRKHALAVTPPRGLAYPEGPANLAAATLSELVADPRNGVPLCEMHHQAFDHHRLSLTPPPSVIDFASEYGLEHLLEPASISPSGEERGVA